MKAKIEVLKHKNITFFKYKNYLSLSENEPLYPHSILSSNKQYSIILQSWHFNPKQFRGLKRNIPGDSKVTEDINIQ